MRRREWEPSRWPLVAFFAALGLLVVASSYGAFWMACTEPRGSGWRVALAALGGLLGSVGGRLLVQAAKEA